jgi:hypothetical protein
MLGMFGEAICHTGLLNFVNLINIILSLSGVTWLMVIPSSLICYFFLISVCSLLAKKMYRLKEDQAFSLSLELDRREKIARHPSADFLLHYVGGGGDFVDSAF